MLCSARFLGTLLTILLIGNSFESKAAFMTGRQFSRTDTLINSVIYRDAGVPSDSVTSGAYRRDKLIVSILAFPIPFGFVGLHRIYLGTEPWVPIVYLCTGGGGCGLLPLIDFIFIITADEEELKKYENNPKLFMFVE